MLQYEKKLKPLARNLRRNSTDAELLLWSKIRAKQLKGQQFYRQKTIDRFIADFYCPKSRLVIEVDGGQHYSDNGKDKDKQRDEYMMSVGIAILRFSDREVLENIETVIEEIWSRLS